MTAVQVLFIVRAVATFPGEDVRNAYVMGLDYNSTLERRSEQRRLGWEAEAGVQDGSLAVRISDAAGNPVTGLRVTVKLRQIGKGEEAEVFTLSETTPGEYIMSLRTAGRISVAIEAQRKGREQPDLEATKTLVIP
jgi:nitrogen fixation protein FixH